MAESPTAMTPLGARAFNQHTDDDAEREYDRLRDLAREEGDKMQSCFDRAHQAYERGDGSEAHQLSEQGKRHKAQRDGYNKQASEYIFRENNAPGRVTEDTIDLHGQFAEEAEEIVKLRIRDGQSRGQTHVHVIVGKGKHSTGQVQKIKPRVEKVCRELGLDFATEDNAGRIYVDLKGNKVDAPPPLPPQPGGYQGGFVGHADGGAPEHGHQSQGGHNAAQQQGGDGQHRPPRSQQDELEQFATNCLKKCCLVM